MPMTMTTSGTRYYGNRNTNDALAKRPYGYGGRGGTTPRSSPTVDQTEFDNSNNRAWNGTTTTTTTDLKSTTNRTMNATSSRTSTNGTNNNYTGHRYGDIQHSSTESASSSAGVGFLLFLLGMFACSFLLYLLGNRIYRSNSNGNSTTTTTAEAEATTSTMTANEVFDAMTLKERRHYIETVLNVKTYEGVSTMDIECPDTTNQRLFDVPVDNEESTALRDALSNLNKKKDDDADDNSVDVPTVVEELSLDYYDLCSSENDETLDRSTAGFISDATTLLQQQPAEWCVICFESFEIGDDISYSADDQLLCQHEYHMTCITEWLMKHPNCPYCRRNYIPLPVVPPAPTTAAAAAAAVVSTAANIGLPDVNTESTTDVVLSSVPEIASSSILETTADVGIFDGVVPIEPSEEQSVLSMPSTHHHEQEQQQSSTHRIRTHGYPIPSTSSLFWRERRQPPPQSSNDQRPDRTNNTNSIHVGDDAEYQNDIESGETIITPAVTTTLPDTTSIAVSVDNVRN